MKKALLLICAICSIGLLSACNTVHGVGEDVSAAGHGIQKVAS